MTDSDQGGYKGEEAGSLRQWSGRMLSHTLCREGFDKMHQTTFRSTQPQTLQFLFWEIITNALRHPVLKMFIAACFNQTALAKGLKIGAGRTKWGVHA